MVLVTAVARVLCSDLVREIGRCGRLDSFAGACAIR
jgi:hypothetical protein